MQQEWYFHVTTSSAGTIRSAVLRGWRVEYDASGKVIFSNIPDNWPVPDWPGDGVVTYGIYSLGFNA